MRRHFELELLARLLGVGVRRLLVEADLLGIAHEVEPVGDCGIAARIAYWARLSSSSDFPKYPRAAAFTPYGWLP